MKKLYTILLIMLLIPLLASAEPRSKTLYDVVEKELISSNIDPQLKWIDVTPEGYTFMGDEDYEKYIFVMQKTLMNTPIHEEQPWYLSTPSLMVYSFIIGGLLL